MDTTAMRRAQERMQSQLAGEVFSSTSGEFQMNGDRLTTEKLREAMRLLDGLPPEPIVLLHPLIEPGKVLEIAGTGVYMASRETIETLPKGEGEAGARFDGIPVYDMQAALGDPAHIHHGRVRDAMAKVTGQLVQSLEG
jgi:hypothetical protein